MKKNGQEAIEFVLITALVFFGALFTFLIFGEKISNFFTSDSSSIKVSKADPNLIDPDSAPRYSPDYETSIEDGTIAPGDLNGTPENPVLECNNGLCTIDFGDFILNDIPENFNQYVGSAGSSGGTDKIASYIEQIALQLEAEGKTTEAETIKKLANLGHNIASLEKAFEEQVNSCNGDSNCIQSFMNQPIGQVPDNFDQTFFNFPVNKSYSTLLGEFEIGWVQYNGPENYANDHMTAGFLSQFNEVLNDSSITDPIKGVIQELYWDIGIISEDFADSIYAVNDYSDGGEFHSQQTNVDPLTGIPNWNSTTINIDEVFDHLNNYDASRISNFDAALICGAGYSSDSGTHCH